MRYYERLGLVQRARAANGYREYDDGHLRAVVEIRELASTGITARKTARSWNAWSSGTGTATSACPRLPPTATASPRSIASSPPSRHAVPNSSAGWTRAHPGLSRRSPP
ncbi:MerR family transcriptional regulator [Leifsonia aquatica]|uniref:MerR family transcriptional regulator n=1 Tax=Leifsonia aquatica TaxID=144185 RepID=UPI00384C670E